jgi:cell division protein FtsZ
LQLRGAHMIFIVAGMGGSTGSGVAPVVAQIAQKMGISNVAVAIHPFEFEGEKRRAIADDRREDETMKALIDEHRVWLPATY